MLPRRHSERGGAKNNGRQAQTRTAQEPNWWLTAAGRKKYNRETGAKLKAPVTGKVKKGSKAAKRRKSFCSRMKGMKAKLTSAKTRNDPNSRINLALKKWNC